MHRVQVLSLRIPVSHRMVSDQNAASGMTARARPGSVPLTMQVACLSQPEAARPPPAQAPPKLAHAALSFPPTYSAAPTAAHCVRPSQAGSLGLELGGRGGSWPTGRWGSAGGFFFESVARVQYGVLVWGSILVSSREIFVGVGLYSLT